MESDKVWICVDCVYRSEYHEKQNDIHEIDYRIAKQLYGAEPQVWMNPETNDLDVIDFSKARCEYCNTTLAGWRFSSVVHKGDVIK